MVNAQTQAFTAKPRAVEDHHGKYRDEEEDVYYANIHFDKRVHRGSNYTRPEAATIVPQERRVRAKRRPKKEPAINPFSIDLPKPERLPVDLLSHLVERPREKIYGSEGSQTAEFKQRPPSPPFIPKKTGVDVSTHIEEGELFNFDVEVTPLLDVLVTKTLEQATLEVEEEAEIIAMKKYKESWIKERIGERKIEEEAVEEERQRHAATQRIKKQRLDLREDNVRRKTMCQYATRHFLKDLTANAIYSLQNDHGLLRNRDKQSIVCDFMPAIYDGALKNLQKRARDEQVVQYLIKTHATERLATRKRTLQTVNQKVREIEEAEIERRKRPPPKTPTPPPDESEQVEEPVDEEAAAPEDQEEAG